MNVDPFEKPTDPELMTPMPAQSWPEDHRAGFVSLLGRPNTGKSTLINALVGQKIAIISDRPQTTRRLLRGIVSAPAGQLVIVDTPGVHRPRTLLGERLNDQVREMLNDVDAVALCLPANEAIGPGDRRLLGEATGLRVPLIAVVTKSDTVKREVLAQKLLEVSDLAEFADIVPVSAVAADQVDVLTDVFMSHMPLSPPLYPDGDVTDEPVETSISELVREAALGGVRDELPHSIAVTVDEMNQRESKPGDTRPPLVDVHVTIHVERDSQKAIIIGRKGARLKDVGSKARRGIEALLGKRVYLDLHVTVAKDWQRDPKLLSRLGL